MIDEIRKQDEVIVSVALYIHGTELDPSHVTHALAIEPTDSWRKGDKRDTRHGKIAAKKKGMWTLYSRSNGEGVGSSIDNLLKILYNFEEKMKYVKGIEDCYIDIFVASSGEFVFSLPSETLSALGLVGVPVQFTYSPD